MTYTDNHRLCLWNLRDGSHKQTLTQGDDAHRVDALRADNRLLMASRSSDIMLWDLERGTLRHTVQARGAARLVDGALVVQDSENANVSAYGLMSAPHQAPHMRRVRLMQTVLERMHQTRDAAYARLGVSIQGPQMQAGVGPPGSRLGAAIGHFAASAILLILCPPSAAAALSAWFPCSTDVIFPLIFALHVSVLRRHGQERLLARPEKYLLGRAEDARQQTKFLAQEGWLGLALLVGGICEAVMLLATPVCLLPIEAGARLGAHLGTLVARSAQTAGSYLHAMAARLGSAVADLRLHAHQLLFA